MYLTLLYSLMALPQAPADDVIVVPMQPCDMTRKHESFYTNSSSKLVLKGSVKVGEETFDIFLPKDKDGWSIQPRPKRQKLLTAFTSTYLSVDQNHDGKITETESYFAEHPIRLGDSMFQLTSIAEDGTLTLIPSDSPLMGPVIGRKAPDFEWTTTDGKVLRRDDFLGRTLVVDSWAPS